MTEVVLYYREGCHLCEEMAAVLHRGWPDLLQRIEWRDVDRDETWRSRHGLRVPVLMIGDECVCEYFPDVDRLRARFGEPANPL